MFIKLILLPQIIKPILGPDFLTKYGLQLDMNQKKLTDLIAIVAATLNPSKKEASTFAG